MFTCLYYITALTRLAHQGTGKLLHVCHGSLTPRLILRCLCNYIVCSSSESKSCPATIFPVSAVALRILFFCSSLSSPACTLAFPSSARVPWDPPNSSLPFMFLGTNLIPFSGYTFLAMSFPQWLTKAWVDAWFQMYWVVFFSPKVWS